MLSKRTFLPTKSLFVAAGIAACGLAAVQQSANALSFNFLGKSGQDYSYEMIVNGGESITPGESLVFSGMTGVTANSLNNGSGIPSAAFFTANGTTDSTATFNVVGPFGPEAGTGPFTVGNFVITSTARVGDIGWALGSSGDTIDGPVLAAVPFEFSPGLGLFLSGTIFGALKLRSKFGKKEELNF